MAQESPTKPNFVFILTDDMRADDLNYMPKTRSLLRDKGMRFKSAYVSTALCCPSRATILRGQYAHNTGVWDNVSNPNGGWEGFRAHGNEQDNLATRLDDAGYRTGLFGKYFNGYEKTFVPPGWDDWNAQITPKYFDYKVNDNGTIRRHGSKERDYVTDVLSRQTRQFIDTSARRDEPFFAYVASTAPHGPHTPPARDERTFDDKRFPRPPSFNERDVSDKPPGIRSLPRLDADRIAKTNRTHERRAESLQAVDSLVEAVTKELRSVGELDNTYVVFTSDNGRQLGEHRIPKGKGTPYEESVSMPLLIRGPGVQAGSTTNKLTLNTDFFPTFMDLAGLETPGYVDGRSLKPLLKGSAPPWRNAILLEHRESLNKNHQGPSFSGILTSDEKKYIEYRGGFRELYDLKNDPYELENSYDTTAPPNDLAARLESLEGCAGTTCRQAEDRP